MPRYMQLLIVLLMLMLSACSSFSHITGTIRFRTLSRSFCVMNERKYPRPNEIKVPIDRLEIKFVRSGGAGGQNVNKLNTKAEVRFQVDDADWIPAPVRERLAEYQKTRMSKEGMLIVTSQEHRTQARNRDDAIGKLQAMIAEAYVEPKDREMWEGIGDKTKKKRRDDKRHRAKIKEGRGNKRNFDD